MKKKKVTKAITTITLMVLGACVGFLAAKFGMDSAKATPASHMIAFIILFLPAFFLVIGFHEAGHAMTGIWVDFEFRMYVVGPFMWEKEESGWRFKWNKNVNLLGGMVICLPKTTDNMAKRFSLYALGGPFASFVLAALTYGIRSFIYGLNLNGNTALGLIGSVFGLISFLSLLIFVITIIPLHTGGFYTDGARAIRFMRGGDTARFELLLMKLITSSSSGIRPRLQSIEEIKEALALALKLDAPMKVYVHYFLHHHFFDNDNLDQAEEQLAQYLGEIENIPKGMRGSAFLDATIFYAIARRDLTQAEFYWKQYAPSALIPKAQVLVAEAAISYLRRDDVELAAKIKAAYNELPNMMDRGVGITFKDKLQLLKIPLSVNLQ